MKNKHGLDAGYFTEKLQDVTARLDDLTPLELVEELSRLMLTAAAYDDINVEVLYRNKHRHK